MLLKGRGYMYDLEDGELPDRHREVPGRRLPVERTHLFPGDGCAQLSAESSRVLGVIVLFHGPSIVSCH